MKLNTIGRLAIAAVATGLIYATVAVAAPSKSITNFRTVWNDKKASNLDKRDAIEALPASDLDAFNDYITLLESDVWQFRKTIMDRIKTEATGELLAACEAWLFDEKKSAKQAAASEHILHALYNNRNWVRADKWQRAPEIVNSKAHADKVKFRMVRELGTFRWRDAKREQPGHVEAQAEAKINVRVLVPLLETALAEKRKPNRELIWLLGDALESLTGEEYGSDVTGLEQWKFFVQNLTDTVMLKPRQATRFSDPLADINLEGQTFARKNPRRGGDEMEILILPNLGTSSEYWFPYIFELNKTFPCTFVELPDCSRMKNLQYLNNPDGSQDKNAYLYPLAQLVEAFEARRESSGKKKIGLIAHGVSGWIALEYLRLRPESVEFAIIIQTWSGGNAFGKAREAIENNREQDQAFKWLGQDMLYDRTGNTGSLSLNESQKYWAQTGRFKRRWADPTALEPLFYSVAPWERPVPGPRIIVPDYDFNNANRGKKIDVPVMYVAGTKDLLRNAGDQNDYKRVFTKLKWVDFANSADTPWAEEPVKFFDEFNKLLTENKILEKHAKGDKK